MLLRNKYIYDARGVPYIYLQHAWRGLGLSKTHKAHSPRSRWPSAGNCARCLLPTPPERLGPLLLRIPGQGTPEVEERVLQAQLQVWRLLLEVARAHHAPLPEKVEEVTVE